MTYRIDWGEPYGENGRDLAADGQTAPRVTCSIGARHVEATLHVSGIGGARASRVGPPRRRTDQRSF